MKLTHASSLFSLLYILVNVICKLQVRVTVYH